MPDEVDDSEDILQESEGSGEDWDNETEDIEDD
jgi:hypothetical protein